MYIPTMKIIGTTMAIICLKINSKTIKVLRSWIVETAVAISSFEIYKHGNQNMHMIFFVQKMWCRSIDVPYRHGPARHGVALDRVPEARHHVLCDEPVERLEPAEHGVHGYKQEQHDPVEQVQPSDLLSVRRQVWAHRGRSGSRGRGRRRRHILTFTWCTAASVTVRRRAPLSLLPSTAERQRSLLRSFYFLYLRF